MNLHAVMIAFTTISIAMGQFCLTPNATGTPLMREYSCALGFYCPNASASVPYSIPQLCPPTIDCQVRRLSGSQCDPQGIYEPSVCTKGNYCPDYTQRFECPEGHFCPTGTFEPHPCPPLSSCPAGSSKRFYYGSIVIVAIVDVFLIAAFFGFKFYSQKASRKIKPISTTSLGSKIQPSRFDFKFDRLRYVLKDGKVILSGITGEIRHGRVTAIMGPSGSGKTTFLSVLTGKVKRSSGTLQINGKETEMGSFKKFVGFVPQEDTMLRELTARENITFSAKIRLPSSWDSHRTNDLIDDVIQSLNLTQVQNTCIGDEIKRGVSGGQRKRVNIGIELAAAPSVLFLDEPTSGLDSTQALQVANILKELAAIGMTVVTVIHQPRYEIFQSFDDVILLSPGGHVAYIGPVNRVQEYFVSLGFQFDPRENPADVLMDIISGNIQANGEHVDLGKAWEDQVEFNLKVEDENLEVEEMDILDNVQVSTKLQNKDQGAALWKQVILNHNRYLLQQYRSVGSFQLEIFVATLAGILMGISVMGSSGELYKGILISPYTLISGAPQEFLLPMFGLIVGIAVGLSGAPAGVKTFGEEKPLHWREYAAGHSRVAYYLGKVICTVYRFAITSLHFSALYYILATPGIEFGRLYVIVFMLFFNVYALASFVSLCVKREDASLLAVVICLIVAVLNGFGPSIKSADSWGIGFLWQMSYGRWATEALYNEETQLFRHIYQVENLSAPAWGYSLDRFGFDIGMMFVSGMVYRILAFVALYVADPQTRREAAQRVKRRV
eukprot:TRINITY_DN6197_c1_g1_i1.p1 TRINITY_DN6197_c1_g1~~TRINITY_DN6197_c1_g1_i1.p1  ORF type:complete len:781 (+),score=218.38 TRINITY_DN6197_c1_g1_i1:3-2345(+)